MSELRAWARRDSSDHALDVPAMAVRDVPRLPAPIADTETRIREALDYRKHVEAVYAGDIPERMPVERPDKPANGIAKRRESAEHQREKQEKPERSRLPSNETTQFAVSLGIMTTTIADIANILPNKLDAVTASILTAVVAGVAWGNKRWKDKHADRPED